MTDRALKEKFDSYVNQYETADFIENDPIRFPHRFKVKEDIELSGFIASLFAFGKRELFIKKLDIFFEIANQKPFEYISKGDFSEIKKIGFNYRFIKPDDFAEMLNILSELYKKDGGLETLFCYAAEKSKNNDIIDFSKMFKIIVDYFYSRVKNPVGQGFYFMLPNSENGGAMKRLCMYMRWMVRGGDVDFGIWNFISPAQLLIPLDVHVARVSRENGLLKRKSNDFRSVLELTEKLREFCPSDPVKYDFAMFAYGVNNPK